MKKAFVFIAVAVAMLATGTAKAQLGVHFGYAPVTETTLTTTNNSTTTTTFGMDGFFVGVTYNYALNKDMGVAFGAQGRFNTKTTTESANYIVISGNGKYTYTQFLIDVPILFNYSFSLGSSAKLVPFVGPTISYALTGNTHESTSTNSIIGGGSSENDYPWYGDNSTNSRLDLSATLGVEFQFTSFRVFGGYRLGLLDIDTQDKVKTTTSGIFVGLGYAL